MVIICPKCGKIVDGSQGVCPECFCTIDENEVSPAFCQKCGSLLPKKARFCIICNAPVNEQGVEEDKKEEAPKNSKKWLALVLIVLSLGFAAGAGLALLVGSGEKYLSSQDTVNASYENTEQVSDSQNKNPEGAGENAELDFKNTPTPIPDPTLTPSPVPTATPTPTFEPTPSPVPTPTLKPEKVETMTVAGGYEAPLTDFVFPFSSERKIEMSELNRMTPSGEKDVDIASMSFEEKQLRLNISQIAIDEIVARHGKTVADNPDPSIADLFAREWFFSLEWYRKANSYYLEGHDYKLNAVEEYNIDLLYHWQHQYWEDDGYVPKYTF